MKLAKRRQVLSEFASENALSFDGNVKDTDDNVKFGPTEVMVSTKHLKRTTKQKRPQRTRSQISATIPEADASRPSKQQQEIQDVKRLRLEVQQVLLNLQRTQDERRLHLQSDLLKMDIEEEQRLLVRHLEQMRKHSRTIYTLQQQVQVIKQHLKKGVIGDSSTIQSRLLGKVAAAHRGTSRLLHVYCQQLPEYLVFPDNFVAVNALFQEVSKLIKELSLCALQLNLADVEEVERISEVMKTIEPKCDMPRKPAVTAKTPKSPGRKVKTPPRLFKSKDVSGIKKSLTKPKLPRPSFSTPQVSQRSQDLAQSFHAVDLIDRPEWRPPSNSPYKSVGPPALGPLLESPSSKVSTKPKTVTFFSTPREHDIDSYHHETATDIKGLKSRLADELEAELKTRIQPLLRQVDELARSSQRSSVPHRNPDEAMLENQVREIVAETKRELQNFQKEQEIEQEAVQLHQRPSLESLLLRLDVISQEEETIRRRWQEINYHDVKDEPSIIQETVPKTPQGFKFTKTSRTREDQPKQIINFIPDEDRFDCPHPTSLCWTRPSESNAKSTSLPLILPESTVYAVEKGRKDFERHLRYAFHEPKGKFNPWKLVEVLSDDILNDVVAAVSQEVNGMCEFYAEEIFEQEFADAPNLTDSSLMTSASSVMDSLACK